MIKFILTPTKKRKIFDKIHKFIEEYEVTCSESVYQVDEVNLACPELVGDIIDILGVEYIE